MKNLAIALAFLVTFSLPVTGEVVEIHSLNRMDDPRGYCIDIRGHKSKAKINNGLQAHTCYSYQGEIAVDQGFSAFHMTQKQFNLPAFNVCMEASSASASSSLQLGKCQEEQLQQFDWDDEGKIHLTSNMKLCLTISQGQSRKGGGGTPVHLIRNLSLELCSDTLQPFQTWGIRN